MQNNVLIKRFIHCFKIAFEAMEISSQRIKIEDENSFPFISIDNNYFVFFENKKFGIHLSFEQVEIEDDTTFIIKTFDLEKSFDALNYIVDYYFNSKVKSKMEREFYEYEI